MGIIQQLDEQLSNQIAAGEVVERPASVVKELIENAFDTEADKIHIELTEGGLQSIRVTDNGHGLQEDDLERAFFRHATSKIHNEHDLFRIKTLGFRGEALPSIASVAQVRLVTSQGGTTGHEIMVKGGEVIRKQSASPRKGTDVTVTDLFYNTPARLKYLRTIHTEVGHVSDTVNRMALSRPDVSFVYSHNNKTLLQTAGNGDARRVMAAIYGMQVALNAVEINAENQDFNISGYIVKPEIYRANRTYMTVLLNQRFVKSYPVIKAVQNGYHTLLPIGKFPIVVISIRVHPHLVDVNVHPSKLEVRLSKETELMQLVTDAIKEAFAQETLIPEVKESVPLKADEKQKKSDQLSLEFDEQQHRKEEPKRSSDYLAQISEERVSFENKESADEDQVSKKSESRFESSNGDIQKENVRVPKMYPVGQLHGTYIIAENELGMYMIDQHAAQERIYYEFFRNKVDDPPKVQQDLLVPLTVELTQQEAAIFSGNLDEIRRLGMDVEPFGQNTYLIRSVPVWFPDGDEEDILYEWLEQLKTGRKLSVGAIREDAAILMSCKAAIKANRHLRLDEMEHLLDDLRQCTDPFSCPHGRPIIIHHSTKEIERMFKRIM
ncbi:DNA mismatch repair endonuclease MutL [Salisediminibacterium beveridgei]|uniref:DNA mismatch repair protein MutL n=1 Tax=Salisediminibacterium beveridgei TaxID=632773 RepID=A0A1D7QVV8_9BACI|nr:DNA mismatch repair endonuclease MutL [Salisediminibacterium beveridgei]AOM83109.1 DNA mismatch repair protein MutL [Salisediminibacterium beveridgei]